VSRLDEIISKLSAVTDDVIDEGLLKVVEKNKSEAIDFNTSQLFAGKDSKGQPLGFYRNQQYAAFKNYMNPTPGFGVMDWKLTGELYGNWFVDASRFPVTFGSTDEKFESLNQQNEEAKGLDQTNLEAFRQDIKPDIQDLFRSLLRL
jgi:hypothetical protein